VGSWPAKRAGVDEGEVTVGLIKLALKAGTAYQAVRTVNKMRKGEVPKDLGSVAKAFGPLLLAQLGKKK
jgi:hypothetical protein